MKERLLSTEGLICIIVVIWIFNILVFKIKYASLKGVFSNYFRCFINKNGKLLIGALVNYFILPVALAVVAAREKIVNSDIIEILTIIVSILTSMLFTLLSMIIEMKAKVKNSPNYFSIEAKVSEEALIETYYAIMFEITMSVILLILCLLNAFVGYSDIMQSILIYSMSFIVICNLLIIIKRIFKVIDTDMNK